jgi:hypothetical protein
VALLKSLMGALVACVYYLILILPANFSTSIDFAMILMLVFIENPIKVY